jgi:hypothetical protein
VETTNEKFGLEYLDHFAAKCPLRLSLTDSLSSGVDNNVDSLLLFVLSLV